MSTSVDEPRPLKESESAETGCDATCSCNARGLSTRAKTGVCLVVALVAVALVLLGSANKARTATKTDAFASAPAAAAPMSTPAAATPMPTPAAVSPTTTPATDAPAAPAAAKAEPTSVWGPTLNSLASLNELAADKDAVFVFVPAKDGKQTGAIREQVAAAAKKARARDSSITAYMLSTDAEEYALIAGQVPPPCVIALVKGAGMAPVSGEITEAKLLEALVTASRPSGCGPSGCGPSGCG